ncbi:MAG: L-threonylcarbamoyladenylate synthase [Terriglobia bacterium]|jgi:L-threonylcarbamoyladenylate synthase|nr:L-threonylcarbamoyladenylate synthase [Terriglobia bacterium]
MKTQVLQVRRDAGKGDRTLWQAALIIRLGGLVAFPTETVYGLGANALDRAAILRIFEAKKRPTWDPIIVHASNLGMLRNLVRVWPEKAEALAQKFMPGPLTLLLPKRDVIPSVCTAGRDKVGVRIPSHPVARALIDAAQTPIAAPSANLFGGTSPTTAAHVLDDLDGRIDAVLDAGPADVGVESTVIDPTQDYPAIYRPGGVTREQIEEVIGPVHMVEHSIGEEEPTSLESPGLGIRHYAPKSKLVLVESEDELSDVAMRVLQHGQKIGLMLPSDWLHGMQSEAVVFDWGKWNDLDTLAQRLYAGLRWLDEQGVEITICPMPSAEGLGVAIQDRLKKAAG